VSWLSFAGGGKRGGKETGRCKKSELGEGGAGAKAVSFLIAKGEGEGKTTPGATEEPARLEGLAGVVFVPGKEKKKEKKGREGDVGAVSTTSASGRRCSTRQPGGEGLFVGCLRKGGRRRGGGGVSR